MDGRRSAAGAYLLAAAGAAGHAWRGLVAGAALLAGALVTAATLVVLRVVLFLDDLVGAFR